MTHCETDRHRHTRPVMGVNLHTHIKDDPLHEEKTKPVRAQRENSRS